MKKLWKKITKIVPATFLLFVIFGCCTFLLDFLLYMLFLRLGIPMNAGKAASSMIAVLFNYILNSRFNFGKNNPTTPLTLVAYFAVYAVLIGAHVVINRLLFALTNNKIAAVILAMTISVFLNYFTIRLYFRVVNKLKAG